MGLDSSTQRECPLPRYWGSMGISLCPSGTGGVPTLKSSFLLHLDRKKNCLFQPGNLSLQCLINSVLFTWGCGKCLSGVCGNGHVFGQEHTLVTQQERRCSAIIPYWLHGTKSNRMWRRPGKTCLELFVGASMDLLQRKGNITERKMPLPPSLLFSKWFKRLDIYFFIFREVISTMEEPRKTESSHAFHFALNKTGLLLKKKIPCLFLILGKNPLWFAHSNYFEALSFLKRQWWNSTELIIVSQKFSYHPFFFFFSSLNFPPGLLLCWFHAVSFPIFFWSKFSGTVKKSLRTNAEWGHWLTLTHRIRSPSYWVISEGLQNLTLHVHRSLSFSVIEKSA